MFKYLHDVEALFIVTINACITRRYIAFRFRTQEQRVKAINFDICKWPPKTNWLP